MSAILTFFIGAWGLGAIAAAVGVLVLVGVLGRAVPLWAWVAVVAALSLAIFAQRDAASSERLAHAKTLQQIAEKTAAAQAAVNALIQERAVKVAALDAQVTKEKANAVKANEDRRRALAAGNVRMRLAGTSCPAAPDLPATSATARLDDGAGITVSRETGQAVSDLRAALIVNEAQIAGLQRYVREVCMEGAK